MVVGKADAVVFTKSSNFFVGGQNVGNDLLWAEPGVLLVGAQETPALDFPAIVVIKHICALLN